MIYTWLDEERDELAFTTYIMFVTSEWEGLFDVYDTKVTWPCFVHRGKMQIRASDLTRHSQIARDPHWR